MTSTSPNAKSAPQRVVDLRSDTVTLPTPRMYEAIAAAELGDDVYGEDPTVTTLEELAAARVGKPAACFMPSGTMANLASLLVHCSRGAKAIVGDLSDIYVYEAGGASALGGIVLHPVPNKPDGTIALADLEKALPPDPADPQFAPAALICLEDPQNHCGGRVLPMEHLAEVRAFADEHDLSVHLDGSRIFNAALAAGVEAGDIAEFADSVQFCLSKGLAAPIGSIIAGSADFIAQIRRVRKMLGGGMRQAGIIAAAGIVALRDVAPRLAEDHATALRLAQGLAELPGVVIEAPVRINMVFFRLDWPGADHADFIVRAEKSGIRLAELGRGRFRAVTHIDVDAAGVDHALDVLRGVLPNSRTGVLT